MVTTEDDHRLLVDGGMRASYSDYVAGELGRLAQTGGKLDLVCISHIDQDHISGILQMLDDAVAWRVHRFQLASGNDTHPEPRVAPPPEISGIWHNGFKEQVGDNAGEIEDIAIATGVVLSGSEDEQLRRPTEDRQQLGTSVAEAIRVARRLSPEQLGVPFNADFGGGLVHVPDQGPAPVITLGSMKITVIAPQIPQLQRLRAGWDKWLKDNQDALADIEADAEEDENAFGLGIHGSVGPLVAEAEALAARLLGDIRRVTVPNLASIMLLVEEGSTSFLLTGDGHATHVTDGLRIAGRLSDHHGLHVSVLKVQHHGSEYNLTPEFCHRITADHYVFCADGDYKNPDLEVVTAIIDSRLGDPTGQNPNASSTNPEVGDHFTFWFNSSPELVDKADKAAHLEQVRALVTERADASGGQMHWFFRPSPLDPNSPGWTVTL